VQKHYPDPAISPQSARFVDKSTKVIYNKDIMVDIYKY